MNKVGQDAIASRIGRQHVCTAVIEAAGRLHQQPVFIPFLQTGHSLEGFTVVTQRSNFVGILVSLRIAEHKRAFLRIAANFVTRQAFLGADLGPQFDFKTSIAGGNTRTLLPACRLTSVGEHTRDQRNRRSGEKSRNSHRRRSFILRRQRSKKPLFCWAVGDGRGSCVSF